MYKIKPSRRKMKNEFYTFCFYASWKEKKKNNYSKFHSIPSLHAFFIYRVFVKERKILLQETVVFLSFISMTERMLHFIFCRFDECVCNWVSILLFPWIIGVIWTRESYISPFHFNCTFYVRIYTNIRAPMWTKCSCMRVYDIGIHLKRIVAYTMLLSFD